jgi:hypothetical protein
MQYEHLHLRRITQSTSLSHRLCKKCYVLVARTALKCLYTLPTKQCCLLLTFQLFTQIIECWFTDVKHQAASTQVHSVLRVGDLQQESSSLPLLNPILHNNNKAPIKPTVLEHQNMKHKVLWIHYTTQKGHSQFSSTIRKIKTNEISKNAANKTFHTVPCKKTTGTCSHMGSPRPKL